MLQNFAINVRPILSLDLRVPKISALPSGPYTLMQ
jgi:hypothetical protein